MAHTAGGLVAVSMVAVLALAGTANAQSGTVKVVRGTGSNATVEYPLQPKGTGQQAQAAPIKNGKTIIVNKALMGTDLSAGTAPTTGWEPSNVRSTVVVPRGPGAEPPQMVSPLQSTRYGAVPRAVLPRAPSPLPKVIPDDGSPRTLHLVNSNTGESIISTYWTAGRYSPDELSRLGWFLRDSRNNNTTAMDPDLLDLLVAINRSLGHDGPIEVLSAYRSPETNRWLASVSRGVARDSQHMYGNAIDIRIASRTPAQIRAAALAINRGGVGFYPSNGFVHVDTGPIRQW